MHSIISNRDIDLTARRLLLISVVRPTLEYGSEVWEGNKAQAAALESVMIGGAKRIRTCNEAVRGDMGLDSLQGRRDKAKLKWWYKVATMPEHRYSRKLFVQEWNVKPRRGRQRKYWCKVVDHLFSSLGLDKAEWLEDIRKRSCSLKSFLGVAGEGIDERESSKFEEGLNSKVKLSLYRTFGKIVEFKKYLRGVGDAGTLNSGQERMDLMKSWAGIEEEKAGRSVCCVMQSVRVLVVCCGIVLHTLVLEVPSCWS